MPKYQLSINWTKTAELLNSNYIFHCIYSTHILVVCCNQSYHEIVVWDGLQYWLIVTYRWISLIMFKCVCGRVQRKKILLFCSQNCFPNLMTCNIFTHFYSTIIWGWQAYNEYIFQQRNVFVYSICNFLRLPCINLLNYWIYMK